MSRMTRDEWLDLGLRILAEEGPSGLAVARVCEHAGRTRGSLYHHFADHDALLEGVLERWKQRFTDDVIGAVAQAAKLDALVIALDFRVEQGVRRLAARHEALLPLVFAVDRQRIEFLTSLRRGQGVARAAEVAEIEYAAFLGFQQLDVSKRRLHTLARRFEALVLPPNP